MPGAKKKQVIVVKSLKELSPKKQIFVSRKAEINDNIDELEPTLKGNASPQKPLKGKDGNILSRSILGDPATFDNIDKKNKTSVASVQSGERSMTSGTPSARTARTGKRSVSPKTKDVKIMDEPEPVDIASSADLYIDTLKKQYKKAEDLRKKEKQQETMLMSYLPVNERFNMNKEGQVIARWQERQRDWENIQAGISKRLNAKQNHTLMMAKTDDYRIKGEEYDFIQAAIPKEERFGTNIWIRSLRGNAPRLIQIGHAMTGLYAEIDSMPAVPAIIRKPKPSNLKTTRVMSKAFDETAPLLARREQLSSTLKTIRPHEITNDDADGLFIQTTSLFQWAIDSSKEYFNDLERRKNQTAIGKESLSPALLKTDTSKSIFSPTAAVADESTAKLSLNCSPEVVFDSLEGSTVFRDVTFTNSGVIALEYVWKPIIYEDGVEAAERTGLTFGSEVARLVNTRQATRLSAINLNRNKPKFFCIEKRGVILPGQVVTTTFSFRSENAFSVRQNWQLFTTPSATYTIPSGVVGGKSYSSLIMEIRLHAFAVHVDENMQRRNQVLGFVDSRVTEAVMGDEVRACLRRVRDPVRLRDLQRRQVDQFKRINQVLLRELSPVFSSELPLHVTPARLHALALACVRVTHFNVHVLRDVFSLRRLRLALDPAGDQSLPYSEEEEESQVSAVSSRSVSEDALAWLQDEVFPEKKIEIFDEVTEDQIKPSWDMDVSKLIEGLRESLAITLEIDGLELQIAKLKVQLEKARLREERRAARRAAMDPDDEDDEEEEEEEEEEEDEDAAPRPKHVLTVEAEALVAECRSHLNLLVTKECLSEHDSIAEIVRDCLVALVDNMFDWSAASRQAAGIVPEEEKKKDPKAPPSAPAPVPVPPIPSPFTSAEGQAAWDRILHPHVPEVVVGKGGKPAAKPKPVKLPKGQLAPEQIDQFYSEMHAHVRAGFLTAGGNICARIDAAMQAKADETFAASEQSPASLLEVASLRLDEDAVASEQGTGKVAFVVFDGSPFAPSTAPQSAFDAARQAQRSALEPVELLAQSQNPIRAVVLIYESGSEPSAPTAVPDGSFARVAAPVIATTLAQSEAAKRELFEKTQRKSKHVQLAPRLDVEYTVTACNSLAELIHRLNLLKTTDPTAGVLPVFVVEDLSWVDVVPAEPPLPPLEFDDIEAPIAVGLKEFDDDRMNRWIAKRPHRVQVCVDLVSADGAAEGSVSMGCYSDTAAALTEACEGVKALGGSDALLWVHATLGGAFARRDVGALQRSGGGSLQGQTRVVSQSLRQTMLWCSILRLMPHAVEYLGEVTQAAADYVEGTELDGGQALVSGVEVSMVAKHFAAMFPRCIAEGQARAPRVVAAVGGEIRADKIRILDELVDSVDSIILGGEIAIPFIALYGGVVFSRYIQECAQYKTPCAEIMKKALLRGVKLLLPVDVMTGDEAIPADARSKVFTSVDPDARDEGVDYDGEAKVVTIFDQETDAVATKVVDRYVGDVGERTCKLIQEEVATSDLLVAWGTMGACEVSSFQAGQRALVNAAVLTPMDPEAKPTPEMSTPCGLRAAESGRPAHTWLIGDGTVEWFTRIADTDGELGGDLVAAGRVAFCSRASSAPVGLLGLCGSRVVPSLARRDPLTGGSEWTMNYWKPLEVEDEEEDEEDDD